MNKKEVIQFILQNKSMVVQRDNVKSFASANIALCKYWGKRQLDLNLPITNSLSISLANKGALVSIQSQSTSHHLITVNQEILPTNSNPYETLSTFLNYFCGEERVSVNIDLNIPVAAGLASSAAIYAALVLALNKRYAWALNHQSLSILARLGSGSACRSIDSGFVEWYAGTANDGMDSYAEPLPYHWPELRIGLCIFNHKPKSVSSREGMLRTVATSALYSAWPEKAFKDLVAIKTAIAEKDFSVLGKTAESNALAMHATMMSAWPPLWYATSETLDAMHQVWACRNSGYDLYFTQDAGPNLKLLFLERDTAMIKEKFSGVDIINPFEPWETFDDA